MINIRPMRIEDINIVVEYEKLLFGQSLGYDMIRSELIENDFAYYFVLELNGEFAGYCGCWITDPNSQIINLFIIPEFQGRKLGDLLLMHVTTFLASNNVDLVTLEVRESNFRAQNMYVKHGFKKEYIRKNYYHDGENAILMIKYFK